MKLEAGMRSAAGAALLADAAFGLVGSPAEGEVFYRSMSTEAYETFKSTGKIPPGSETFISPTQAFSMDYEGTLVKFTMKPGTTAKLEEIGVRSTGNMIEKSSYADMPLVKKGWKSTNAFFKQETNKSGLEQINIGLGNGKALNIFNKNIQSTQVIKQ